MEVGGQGPRHGHRGQDPMGRPGECGVSRGEWGVDGGGTRGHDWMFGDLEGGHDHCLGAVVPAGMLVVLVMGQC